MTIVSTIEKEDFIEATFSNFVNIGEILSYCLTRCALQLQRVESDISFLELLFFIESRKLSALALWRIGRYQGLHPTLRCSCKKRIVLCW